MERGAAHDRIVTNPEIRFGKPTISGTRIAVEDILRLTARGLSSEEILNEYSHLTEADIRAAHEYAADYLGNAFRRRPEAAE